MIAAAYPSALQFVPETNSVRRLRAAIPACKGCPLYLHATQPVFGDGPRDAGIMMIGEQPGNEEDIRGLPFIGPAGKLLDRALEQAGLDRSTVYVTNAVKHFKFEERSKRRLHKKPAAAEVRACRPWLDAEIQSVKPHILVCLGATAAQEILGKQFRLTTDRGKGIPYDANTQVLATIHPSAILRIREQEERHTEFERLVGDLKIARGLVP